MVNFTHEHIRVLVLNRGAAIYSDFTCRFTLRMTTSDRSRTSRILIP